MWSSGWCLLLSGLLLAALVTPYDHHGTGDDDLVMVCYYGSWAVYRPGLGKFDVEDIDPFLCTHLIYTFAGLRDNKIVSLDPFNDLYDHFGKGAYIRFTNLRTINPKLRTLLAIGGWNEGSTRYSQMVANAASRATFVSSCVEFLQKYGFDGLDLDWEYPTQRGGQLEDKANFALLLDEMRSEFDDHGLLLTAAVSAGIAVIDAAYDVAALARNLDLVNLMAYDFHGSWERFAHHHSPLYPHPLDHGANASLNVDSAVQHWLNIGLPSEILVLGMGLYGRTFTLANADEHDIYATSSQAGQPGPYTGLAGVLGYNEICKLGQEVAWTVVRDKHLVSPYAYLDLQWCGYDDADSLTVKTEYLINLGLAGAMVWSVETDDFRRTCHEQRFPLINAIRDALRDGKPHTTSSPQTIPTTTAEPEITTTDVTTTATTATTTKPPNTICHKTGFNADPAGDCTVYYLCGFSEGRWNSLLFHCHPDTIFVEEVESCVHLSCHPTCPTPPPVISEPPTTEPPTTPPPTTGPPITAPPTTLGTTTDPSTTPPPTTGTTTIDPPTNPPPTIGTTTTDPPTTPPPTIGTTTTDPPTTPPPTIGTTTTDPPTTPPPTIGTTTTDPPTTPPPTIGTTTTDPPTTPPPTIGTTTTDPPTTPPPTIGTTTTDPPTTPPPTIGTTTTDPPTTPPPTIGTTTTDPPTTPPPTIGTTTTDPPTTPPPTIGTTTTDPPTTPPPTIGTTTTDPPTTPPPTIGTTTTDPPTTSPPTIGTTTTDPPTTPPPTIGTTTTDPPTTPRRNKHGRRGNRHGRRGNRHGRRGNRIVGRRRVSND